MSMWASVTAGLQDVFESVVEAVAEEGPPEDEKAPRDGDADAGVGAGASAARSPDRAANGGGVKVR